MPLGNLEIKPCMDTTVLPTTTPYPGGMILKYSKSFKIEGNLQIFSAEKIYGLPNKYYTLFYRLCL
jgi:hypothetical protein